MAGMELDSPGGRSAHLSPGDRIVERLANNGVPGEILEQSQRGLSMYLKEKEVMIPGLISSILPTESDVSDFPISSKTVSGGRSGGSSIDDFFSESMSWLGWLMFGAEPLAFLENLAKENVGQRAVCGAVWGHNDLAYRCRTCENDPTCAICVPCFQNGNHKDHDYSIIYTGGGCCDCGDATAWKLEGFCSKHRGIGQIQRLPEELADSIRPILDALLVFWKCKLTLAEKSMSQREQNTTGTSAWMTDKLSLAIVEMLLNFCECSESLLSFMSLRMFECTGLLDVLVRAERFLSKGVVKKLHELLLKFLGEPDFKYEFAKVFTRYYPFAVSEMSNESIDNVLEKYPLLPTFSVQIFTVPTLTQRLVQEVNLLGALFRCLRDLLLSCVGEDGRVQASKWIMDIMIRLVEDSRFVLSHDQILVHVTHDEPDISRAWLKILTIAQSMNPHNKVTTSNTMEDEYDNISTTFLLGHLLGNVHNFLVQGAFSAFEVKERKGISVCISDSEGLADNEGYRHSKVGRTSQESSACSTSRSGGLDSSFDYSDVKVDTVSHLSIPSPAISLIIECLKSIDLWLCHTQNILHTIDNTSSSCFNNFRKKVFKLKKGKGTYSYKDWRTSVSRKGKHWLLASNEHLQRFDSLDTDMCTDDTSSNRLSDDNIVVIDANPEFGMLNMADWPDIVYDISTQDMSFHIPLHCFLSLLLRKVMEKSHDLMHKLEKSSSGFLICSPACSHEFFRQVLGGAHPCGFSGFLMEHPLQLRVFCAQVRAGMWRRSGDTAIWMTEFYHFGQWIAQGLESDLFLLQCCAALAPPELFVERVQERFGLSNYTSLNISEHNEFVLRYINLANEFTKIIENHNGGGSLGRYEAVLMQEMLTLIIQIVKERCFSGLSSIDHLKREIIYKLSVGDATHSQVVKGLPRDLSKNSHFQEVLDALATYSNPSGMKQGKYSLRRSYWKELDLYHPRWNYRDLQMAEDRYFRFCKVSALNAQLPRWTKIYYPLQPISRIATSKTVFKIVRAVFFYAAFSDASLVSRAPDGVLITALHLLSLALDICDSRSQTTTCNHVPGAGSCIRGSSYVEDLPPLLTYATEEFDDTANGETPLDKSENMLTLLVLLMRKCKQESDVNYSETKHCNISSLIETLLKKFAELNSDCLTVLQKLAPEVVSHMLKQPAQVSPLHVASATDAEDRRAKARERQAAIMEKMRAEQSKFIASLNSAANNEADNLISKEENVNVEEPASEESAIVCSLCRDPHSQSPLCFLILLQKSRLITFVEKGPPSWEDRIWQHEVQSVGSEHSNNPFDADPNTMLQSPQNSDVEFAFDIEPAEVAAFLDCLSEPPHIRKPPAPNMFHDTANEVSVSFEMLEDEIYHSILRDIHNCKSFSDSLDGEKKQLTNDASMGLGRGSMGESFVYGECFARLARELKHKCSSLYGLQRIANLSSRSIASSAKVSGFGPSDCDGIHISSCGHAVHQECHDRYLLSLKQRFNRRLGFEGVHIVDPDLGELLCPLCRRFSNAILPAPAGVSNRCQIRQTSAFSSSKVNAFPSTLSDGNGGQLDILLALSLLQNAAKVVGQNKILEVAGVHYETKNSALEPALKKMCMLYYPHGYNNLLETSKFSQSLILWETLRYAVTSTEIAARSKMNANSVQSCLTSLCEEIQSSSGYTMSVLLDVAQSSRNCSTHEVLLRFSCLQLLAGSICSGVSVDSYSSIGNKHRGTISSLFECSRNVEAFPDIQFLKRAADPILAYDPFSSFMWVLFCLPVPFISSREIFNALVHLFYVTNIVQAMITCYSKQSLDISCFGGGCLSGICRTMSESQTVRQYFVSNYIDQLCPPKDMIRRLTFPYLRRCALVWNLLNSSTVAPSYDSQIWERTCLSSKDTELDSDSLLKVELNRISELEDMFNICGLDFVLKDNVVHNLALRWCDHFRKEFRVQRYRGVLASTPAVPFKLMELPLVYQDLLQRYIKRLCSNCKSVPEEPALCLLCGKLCSLSRKFCCRPSRCLNHAMICGAGIGVFLLVRKTIIFLQRSTRQAFWPSPYLDAFGEEDHEMSRGKPLYLSKERYAALTYLVASHGLDRSSEVLRQTTINVNGLE